MAQVRMYVALRYMGLSAEDAAEMVLRVLGPVGHGMTGDATV
jgi:hypothetical protein